ncbi:hypothetical protein BBJ28_00018259 [Nothophytophthora sp. Chile5]|nr:hypothetical protein BBJ28_00018259 [Nothophytophthora sp. Chile5]
MESNTQRNRDDQLSPRTGASSSVLNLSEISPSSVLSVALPSPKYVAPLARLHSEGFNREQVETTSPDEAMVIEDIESDPIQVEGSPRANEEIEATAQTLADGDDAIVDVAVRVEQAREEYAKEAFRAPTLMVETTSAEAFAQPAPSSSAEVSQAVACDRLSDLNATKEVVLDSVLVNSEKEKVIEPGTPSPTLVSIAAELETLDFPTILPVTPHTDTPSSVELESPLQLTTTALELPDQNEMSVESAAVVLSRNSPKQPPSKATSDEEQGLVPHEIESRKPRSISRDNETQTLFPRSLDKATETLRATALVTLVDAAVSASPTSEAAEHLVALQEKLRKLHTRAVFQLHTQILHMVTDGLADPESDALHESSATSVADAGFLDFLEAQAKTQVKILEVEVRAGQELLRLHKAQHEKERVEQQLAATSSEMAAAMDESRSKLQELLVPTTPTDTAINDDAAGDTYNQELSIFDATALVNELLARAEVAPTSFATSPTQQEQVGTSDLAMQKRSSCCADDSHGVQRQFSTHDAQSGQYKTWVADRSRKIAQLGSYRDPQSVRQAQHNSPPKMALAKYRVVQLTKEELLVQCKDDDFEQWGAPTLDLPQYQRKEQLQRETPFSQRGSIFWALVDKTDSDDSSSDSALVAGETVLCCHCESHRFDCVVRRHSGELERGYSHHIGSVFTLPAFRKRGLATFFLQEVAKQMAQLPGAVASMLYSDLGPTYYDKRGWRLHPSQMATLEVAHSRNLMTGNSRDGGGLTLTGLLLDDGLDALLKTDNERLVRELSSASFDGREAFVTLPTRDSIEWQFCIGVHFARVRGLDELPSCCGAKVSEDAFVLWCHNLKESTLYVVRTRLSEPDATGAAVVTCLLLRAALEEARKFQLKKVAIWDPPAVLLHDHVRNQLEIVVGEREDSLSSARLFSQGGRGDEEEGARLLPQWLANEKFAWV